MTTHQHAIVCCVESGWLECQTIRMIESLRRWGGVFADAPVLAVIPRFGPPLSRSTLAAFEQLQVEHVWLKNRDRYPWDKFLNKPYAVLTAENHFQTDSIIWLDGDLLIVDEPHLLHLGENEDFVACASDRNIGTTGVNDPNEPYWRSVCQATGIDIEALPWITTEREGANIRLYWNGGVFAYRRSCQFAQHYLDTCLQVFDAQIASQNSGVFFNEQISLGLAMFKAGLRWRSLPESHNYAMGSKTHDTWYVQEYLQAAKIIHYHDAMWPWFWDTFINCLEQTHPDVANWLKPQGAMSNQAPLQWRILRKALDSMRKGRQTAYLRKCKVV
ncbi:hypothetical protein [Calothrix sp. NIES-3974]|uniref:hypothetical protein n=1 Tax=Calothrix sp. NIES-3974 TaxID=2005462 RepID=UPI000B5E70A9|nr:hypothetical protein [Calothrix sp. NIES-3974]BAZ03434.1 hypothetical protein NIES3974_00600 [Calothrix sp. NIES-3974]